MTLDEFEAKHGTERDRLAFKRFVEGSLTEEEEKTLAALNALLETLLPDPEGPDENVALLVKAILYDTGR